MNSNTYVTAIAKLVSSVIDRIQVYLGLIQSRFNQWFRPKEIFRRGGEHFSKLDLSILHCRVILENQWHGDSRDSLFNVQICGTIRNPVGRNHAEANISITDITDGVENSLPVNSRLKRWQRKNSSAFVYNASIGNLPEGNNILSQWVSVARIYYDWLDFPRKGKRDLLFGISILSGEKAKQLAYAEYTITCEMGGFGYNDVGRNAEEVKSLSIALAFAVGVVDNRLYHCEIDTIKNWARRNFDVPQESSRQFEEALDNAVKFFQKGYGIDIPKMCKEIVGIAPPSERYKILDLCLHVVQAKGRASAEETELLGKLAIWLEVDMNKFRGMMEKFLPVKMHEVENIETILGVTSDMEKKQALKHLNNEYKKWNARAVNVEPEVQEQAEDMLDLISRTRSDALREEQTDEN